MTAIWKKQKGETEPSYEAFREYLHLGRDRSLAKLCTYLDRPGGYVRHLERWSARFDWVKRAEAYDEHQRAEELRRRAELVDNARRKAFDMVDDAMTQLAELATGAEKESVQLNAIKEVMRIAGVGEREEEQVMRVDLRISFPNRRRGGGDE